MIDFLFTLFGLAWVSLFIDVMFLNGSFCSAIIKRIGGDDDIRDK